MDDGVKFLLKKLYPDAEIDRGIDFDKSGVLEENEKIRDLDGDGKITDIDYGLLVFNNRSYFVNDHGAKNWKKIETEWKKTGKVNPLFRPKMDELRKTTATTRENEAYQRDVIDPMGRPKTGTLERGPDVASNYVEVTKELNHKYPELNVGSIPPSKREKVLALMNELNDFNPNLSRSVEGLDISFVPPGEDRSESLKAAFIAGGNADLEKNKIWLSTLYQNDLVRLNWGPIHEATHIYHNRIYNEGRHEAQGTPEFKKLCAYARSMGYPHATASKFIIVPKFRESPLREFVQEQQRAKNTGAPYDQKLLSLYEDYTKSEQNTFNYEWKTANRALMKDPDNEHIAEAGRILDVKTREIQAALVKEFGTQAEDAFIYEEYWGNYYGERKEPCLRYSLSEKIKRLPDGSKLKTSCQELINASNEYSASLINRYSDTAAKIYDTGIFWKAYAALTGKQEGLATPYGATNNMEAVAEFVSYVHANGKLPYTNDERHNKMIENNARVLVKYGFIPKDNPAVRAL